MKTFLTVAKLWQTINIYLEVASKRQGELNVTVHLSHIAGNWREIYYFSFSELNACEANNKDFCEQRNPTATTQRNKV